MFRSIGYRGTPLPGLPFDTRAGVISHVQGRVIGDAGRPLPGWYVTGWIKRGPTGVIGTNRADSLETVASLLQDLASSSARPSRLGRQALSALLEGPSHRVVDFAGWQAIERAEQLRGQAMDQPAEKFVRVDDMLAAARGDPP